MKRVIQRIILFILVTISFAIYLSPEEETQELDYYACVEEINGDIHTIKLLDNNGNLTFSSHKGYAYIEKLYDESSQKPIQEMYYDQYGNPTKGELGEYGIARDYDEDGNNYKITYLDSSGLATVNSAGYSSVIREFNDSGYIIKEIYLSNLDIPTKLSDGRYGVIYLYDSNNRQNEYSYIDEYGNITSTLSGYSTIRRGFDDNGNITTELYYDELGNQVKSAKGDYGVCYFAGKKLSANKDGKPIFNIKNILHVFPVFSVFFGLIISLIPLVISDKKKYGLLILYLLFICYMTLLKRPAIATRKIFSIFDSYIKSVNDYSYRIDNLNNIWLFVPMGAILKSIFPKRNVFLFIVMLSILIEFLQLQLNIGICEVDDVMNNCIGAIAGISIYELFIGKKWLSPACFSG